MKFLWTVFALLIDVICAQPSLLVRRPIGRPTILRSPYVAPPYVGRIPLVGRAPRGISYSRFGTTRPLWLSDYGALTAPRLSLPLRSALTGRRSAGIMRVVPTAVGSGARAFPIVVGASSRSRILNLPPVGVGRQAVRPASRVEVAATGVEPPRARIATYIPGSSIISSPFPSAVVGDRVQSTVFQRLARPTVRANHVTRASNVRLLASPARTSLSSLRNAINVAEASEEVRAGAASRRYILQQPGGRTGRDRSISGTAVRDSFPTHRRRVVSIGGTVADTVIGSSYNVQLPDRRRQIVTYRSSTTGAGNTPSLGAGVGSSNIVQLPGGQRQIVTYGSSTTGDTSALGVSVGSSNVVQLPDGRTQRVLYRPSSTGAEPGDTPAPGSGVGSSYYIQLLGGHAGGVTGESVGRSYNIQLPDGQMLIVRGGSDVAGLEPGESPEPGIGRRAPGAQARGSYVIQLPARPSPNIRGGTGDLGTEPSPAAGAVHAGTGSSYRIRSLDARTIIVRGGAGGGAGDGAGAVGTEPGDAWTTSSGGSATNKGLGSSYHVQSPNGQTFIVRGGAEAAEPGESSVVGTGVGVTRQGVAGQYNIPLPDGHTIIVMVGAGSTGAEPGDGPARTTGVAATRRGIRSSYNIRSPDGRTITEINRGGSSAAAGEPGESLALRTGSGAAREGGPYDIQLPGGRTIIVTGGAGSKATEPGEPPLPRSTAQSGGLTFPSARIKSEGSRVGSGLPFNISPGSFFIGPGTQTRTLERASADRVVLIPGQNPDRRTVV